MEKDPTQVVDVVNAVSSENVTHEGLQHKEGIDFVFAQHPELSLIGTKEQYGEYLATLFPASLTQEVMYHGTASPDKIEHFDFSRSNFAHAVFFTSSMDFAHAFAFDGDARNGGVQAQILDVRDYFDFSKSEHREELREVITELVTEGYESSTVRFHTTLPSVYIGEKYIENPTTRDMVDWYMWRLEHGSWRIIETDRVIDVIARTHDSLRVVESGQTNIAVFSEAQIHVLGSQDDIAHFETFLHTG